MLTSMGLTTHVVRGARAERLLFAMHGIGADERDLAPLARELDPDGRFVAVFPRAPYSYGPGYAWFHMGSPELTSGTMRSSVDAADDALDEACRTYHLDREQAVVGGFSQGAIMSFAIAFRQGRRPRPVAVLAMSGYLPEELPIEWPDPPAVLLQHGTYDQLIPVERARSTAETMRSNGVPLVFQEYPMEHQIAYESAHAAAEWLAAVANGERPSADLPQAPADDGPVRAVTGASFESEVLRSDVPVIVDFWAPWCAPCRAVAPVVEQIAMMRQGTYKVVKLNVDQAPEIAKQYEVQSIPMVALFRNGRLERRSVGAKPRPQLEAELGMLVIP